MRFGKKVKALLELTRPELSLAAGVCVLIGALLAAGRAVPVTSLLAAFSTGLFVSASANVLNDLFDLETDRINAPGRPLPSGRVRPQEVIALTVLATFLGLLAAGLLGSTALVMAALLWTVGFLYNWRLKAAGLAGNLMVATCVGGMFLFGGAAAGQPWDPAVWSFAGMVFFFDLGEEIAGGAMDREGDRQRSSRSIALLYGRRPALALASLSLAISILIGGLPFLLGRLGLSYLLALAVMAGIMAFSTIRLWQSRTPAEGRACLRWNSLGGTLFLLAILIERLVG